MQHLAGDGRREIAAQEERRVADLARLDVSSERGHPARQYRLTSDAGSGRTLIVSTPRKVYAFLAFTAGPAPPAQVERFFSSIKLSR